MKVIFLLGTFAFGVWAAGPPTPPGNNPLPLETVDSQTAETIRAMRDRRVEGIVSTIEDSFPFAHPREISTWLFTLDSNGKWPDTEINYTSGCKAQRANWPAVNHWHRLFIMSAAWFNFISDSDAKGVHKWAGNREIRAAIGRGMSWWFQHDFKNPACLTAGDTPQCPCDAPGLWNTNWFGSVIYVPRLVSRTCMLLTVGNSISAATTKACIHPMIRAYSVFNQPSGTFGFLSGANALDIAAIGIDAALLMADTKLLSEAYANAHKEFVLKHKTGQDGIRTDGSFAQHSGALLYAGNYGKDFINAAVAMENTAIGTQWSANDEQKKVLAVLLGADRWMIYRNTETDVLHWDFSALNRFITFPVADGQATANIHLNLTQIGKLGAAWGVDSISAFASSLQEDTPHANAGNLIGNKIFWSNDYLVHRGSNYVTSLKMYSSRTQNSECVNGQNPYGFHLSDGTVYTYLSGTEYEDIAAAWDWSLIPGTTVYPGSGKFECNGITFNGKESFVGGVSDGQVGLGAMKYRGPTSDKYAWQKAWFFLPDDVQVVMVSQLTGQPALSVLDQKRRSGDVVVDDRVLDQGEQRIKGASTLWHSNIGYSFSLVQEPKLSLVVRTGRKKGDWSTIGTSKQPPTTVDLFTAYIEHADSDLVYAVYPGVDRDAFSAKVTQTDIRIIQNDKTASALYYSATNQIFVVFWTAGKLAPVSLSGVDGDGRQLMISANASVAFIYDIVNDKLNVADPSQRLGFVEITMEASTQGSKPFDVELPKGGQSGSSVVKSTSQFIAQAPTKPNSGTEPEVESQPADGLNGASTSRRSFIAFHSLYVCALWAIQLLL